MADTVNEAGLQAKCFQWHWNMFPVERRMLFHVQNKARNLIEGNRFKAMGVVAGISDMVYISHNRVHFIEFKTKTEQSSEQLDFETKVKERGHCYHVVRSFTEFKELITWIRNQKC